MKIAYGTGITFLATMVGAVLLLATVAGTAQAGGTTWVVTTGRDFVGFGASCPHPTDCTLRHAINSANSGDTINFNIPTNDISYVNALGFWRITPIDDGNNEPALVFPDIPGGVTINGYSQLGASPNTLGFGQGSNAVIKIEIDWSNHVNEFGFQLGGNNSTIKGLAITSAGIPISIAGGFGGGDNNQILGNFIGTDPRGNIADGGGLGITIGTDINGDGPSGNQIGSSNPADKNVIVDQEDAGIFIYNISTGNQIHGNLIGLGANGSNLPNGIGVHVLETPGANFVGGLSAGQGNVISANQGWGVHISDGASAVIVANNYIGTNLNGTSARPNGQGGVLVEGEFNNIGLDSGSRNVISGNNGPGVRILTSNNLVQGNYIGTNAAGTAAVPNSSGVQIGTLANGLPRNGNLIGGTTASERNVISGNSADGVALLGLGANDNNISGNYIGTNAAGTAAVANATAVALESASNNTIGGTTNGAGNVLSGNFRGLFINEGSLNEVYGNRVGTNAAGTGAVPNTGEGMFISSIGTRIGGPDANQANTIAFSGSHGIRIADGVSNPILRNSIHSNGGLGIELGFDNVTVNDVNDNDTGPNRLQNYPVMLSAENGSVIVELALQASSFAQYRIEFFASQDCDPTGYGEGQVFLGFVNRTLPANGIDSFEVTINIDAPGAYITATATRTNTEDTSEFSNCIQVPQGETPTPTPTQPGQTPTPTPSATPTPTATPPGQTPTPTPTPTVPGQTPTPTAPGQTSTPTPTPTASPDGLVLLLGDVNCSGLVDPVDALGLLRADAGLSVNKVDPACPDIGDQVSVAAVAAVPEGETIPWGDVDCDLAVGPIDALKVLRHDAGLNVSQQFGCPDIGEPL